MTTRQTKNAQTELPLVKPAVQDCLDTIQTLKHKVLKLSEPPLPPVRLAPERVEPLPEPAPVSVKKEARRVPLQSPAVRPWEGMDPYAPRDVSFKMQLNEYQRTLLAALAAKHGGSQRALATRLLVEAMEQSLGLKEVP